MEPRPQRESEAGDDQRQPKAWRPADGGDEASVEGKDRDIDHQQNGGDRRRDAVLQLLRVRQPSRFGLAPARHR
jgi:hypothetical protein